MKRLTRNDLKKLTEDFLSTYGYIVKPTSHANCELFSRPTGAGILDELLIYFHESGEEDIIEDILPELNEEYKKIPGGEGGRRFFLSPISLGRVPEVVKNNGFTYQVPVWFFDREFSVAKKRTPLKLLEEDAAKYERERIEQPYKINREKGEKGDDLLNYLMKDLEDPKESCLRIIVAPAGYGKTVLMATLYTKLREKFLENKKRQILGKRPLIMLPGHIKKAPDLNGLINNFIGDEYDYGVANIEVFKFWVKKDFVIWLMDGVEELILKIPDEFIYQLLDEYIHAPDSLNPQIIIAIRKPILATSSELRETIEEYQGLGLKLYELCEWEKEQQKKYFDKNLIVNPEDKENFIKIDLTQSAALQKICSIPYYCRLVADLKNNNQMEIFNDECRLIECAIKNLCEREFQKGVDKDILPIESQKYLFVELARESFRHNKITKELLIEIAEILLSDCSENIRENQIYCLLRHALLTQIGEDIDFTHDIIKQYLYGVVLINELINNRVDFFESREIEKDSITFKYLLKNCYNVDWEKVMEATFNLPAHSSSSAIGFRNIMNIFLSSSETPERKKEILLKYQLTNKNLSGLIFKDLNLNNFNIKYSNLAGVEFHNCDLTNAKLDGCHFKNTFFDSNCKMEGMTIKGAILETVKTETKALEDKKEIEEYFYERTKVHEETRGPCQATINLKKFLEKIVRKGRGVQKPKKFLLQTKCGGGIPAEKILEACIKYRLLSEIGEQIKIRINLFDEVEQFVKELRATDNIRKVLDDICKDRNIGCQHL
jgi:hypothetical protein